MRYGTEDPAAKAADDALIAHMFGEGDERPRNDDGPRMGNAEAEDLEQGRAGGATQGQILHESARRS